MKGIMMLVLGRKQHQSIRIGDDIEVVVVAAAGNVKIGITAPPEVPIVRDDAKTRDANAGQRAHRVADRIGK